jgi:hypothetical protein
MRGMITLTSLLHLLCHPLKKTMLPQYNTSTTETQAVTLLTNQALSQPQTYSNHQKLGNVMTG